MYNEFFGLTEAPFAITPDPHFLFMSDRHREAYAHLLYGFSEGGGFVQLTGEVGTGKTTLCRSVLEQLPVHVDVAYILNPRLTDVELLANICDELHISYPEGSLSLKTLVDNLHRYLLDAQGRGRRTVLIIDEAQNLSPDVLEQIRLLTNLETSTQKLLQIILIGQPELIKLLDRQELRQLAQRITARYHLLPFSVAETKAYVAHRLDVAGGAGNVFTRGALTEIYRYSRGLPRLINVICDRSLLGAYVQGHRRVSAQTVRQAIREVTGREVPRRVGRMATLALLSASVLSALGAGYWLRGRQIPGAANPEKDRSTGLADGLPVATPTPASMDIKVAAQELSPSPVRAATLVPGLAAGVLEELPTGVAPTPKAEVSPTPMAAVEPAPAPAVEPVVAPIPAAESMAVGTAQKPVNRDQKLAEVLANENLTSNTDAAFVQLFSLWGVSDPKFASSALGCADARLAGLHCVAGAGGWQEIRDLNLPVIIELPSAAEQKYYAVLDGLDDTTAELNFGGQLYRFSLAEIDTFWRGRYIVLRPPVVRAGETLFITPGMRAREILWVRRCLSSWEGKVPGIAETSDLYDAELKAKVVAFQTSHSLKPDGLISHRTLRTMSAGPAGPVTPSLASKQP